MKKNEPDQQNKDVKPRKRGNRIPSEQLEGHRRDGSITKAIEGGELSTAIDELRKGKSRKGGDVTTREGAFILELPVSFAGVVQSEEIDKTGGRRAGLLILSIR